MPPTAGPEWKPTDISIETTETFAWRVSTHFNPERLFRHRADHALRTFDQLKCKATDDFRLIETKGIFHFTFQFLGKCAAVRR